MREPERPLAALLRFLWSDLRGQGLWAVALLVATTLAQGATVGLLLPLLELVGVGTGRSAAHWLGPTRLPADLWTVLAAFVLLTALATGLSMAQERAAARLHHQAVARIRQRTIDALDGAQWAAIARMDRTRIAYAMTLQAEWIGVGVQAMVQWAGVVALVLLYLGVALWTDAALTALLALAAALLLLVQRPLTRGIGEAGQRLSASLQAMVRTTQTWLEGMKTLRFTPAPPVAPLDVQALQMEAQWHRTWAKGVFEVGGTVLLAGLVAGAVGWRHLEAGALLFLIYLFGRLTPLAGRALERSHAVAQALPTFQTWRDVTRELEASAEAGPVRPVRLQQELELRGVQYRHPEGRSVGPFDLHVRSGERVVLRGPTGVGKTTLLDLASGLLRPDAGEVRIDGQVLVDVRSWRHRVAYVPQEPFLLDASIDENLRWAAPEAGPAERREALGLLQDLEPDVVVGERGLRISGGQRRRVALAMAMLRGPDLLVVDEPTNGLDPVAMRAVLEALDRMPCPVLMASHGPAPAGARVVDLSENAFQSPPIEDLRVG